MRTDSPKTIQKRTTVVKEKRKDDGEDVITFKYNHLKEENEKLVERVKEYADRCLKGMYVTLLILTMWLSFELIGTEDKSYKVSDLLSEAMENAYSNFYAYILFLNYFFVLVVLFICVLLFFYGFFFKGLKYRASITDEEVLSGKTVLEVKEKMIKEYLTHLKRNEENRTSIESTFEQGRVVLFFAVFLVIFNLVFVFAEDAEILCGFNMGMFLLFLIFGIAYYRNEGSLILALFIVPVIFFVIALVSSVIFSYFSVSSFLETDAFCWLNILVLITAFCTLRKTKILDKNVFKRVSFSWYDVSLLSSVSLLFLFCVAYIMQEEGSGVSVNISFILLFSLLFFINKHFAAYYTLSAKRETTLKERLKEWIEKASSFLAHLFLRMKSQRPEDEQESNGTEKTQSDKNDPT